MVAPRQSWRRSLAVRAAPPTNQWLAQHTMAMCSNKLNQLVFAALSPKAQVTSHLFAEPLLRPQPSLLAEGYKATKRHAPKAANSFLSPTVCTRSQRKSHGAQTYSRALARNGASLGQVSFPFGQYHLVCLTTESETPSRCFTVAVPRLSGSLHRWVTIPETVFEEPRKFSLWHNSSKKARCEVKN